MGIVAHRLTAAQGHCFVVAFVVIMSLHKRQSAKKNAGLPGNAGTGIVFLISSCIYRRTQAPHQEKCAIRKKNRRENFAAAGWPSPRDMRNNRILNFPVKLSNGRMAHKRVDSTRESRFKTHHLRLVTLCFRTKRTENDGGTNHSRRDLIVE